jgi:hypothetical protein
MMGRHLEPNVQNPEPSFDDAPLVLEVDEIETVGARCGDLEVGIEVSVAKTAPPGSFWFASKFSLR